MKKPKCTCADMYSTTSTWMLVAITWNCPQHGEITVDRRVNWYTAPQITTWPQITYTTTLPPTLTTTVPGDATCGGTYTVITEQAN